MSATFSTRGCPTGEQVGDVVPVKRLGDDESQIYRYPIENFGEVITWPAWFVVGAFGIAYVGFLLRVRGGMVEQNRVDVLLGSAVQIKRYPPLTPERLWLELWL